MRLLLDQGTPRSTARHLAAHGIDAVHAADIGLSTATDSQILDHARTDHRVVVPLDADFHALLSVISIIEGAIFKIFEGPTGRPVLFPPASVPT
jgi:predicted nuclease of predicted toxin-antitoxin system